MDNSDFPAGHDQADQAQFDLDLAREIVNKSGQDPTTVISASRMGTGTRKDGTGSKFPRLIKVLTTDAEVKKAVLKGQKDVLKSIKLMSAYGNTYSQYIRADLTFNERRQYAELVADRNRLNEEIPEGQPKWKVFNFKLVKFAQQQAPQGNVRRN